MSGKAAAFTWTHLNQSARLQRCRTTETKLQPAGLAEWPTFHSWPERSNLTVYLSRSHLLIQLYSFTRWPLRVALIRRINNPLDAKWPLETIDTFNIMQIRHGVEFEWKFERPSTATVCSRMQISNVLGWNFYFLGQQPNVTAGDSAV